MTTLRRFTCERVQRPDSGGQLYAPVDQHGRESGLTPSYDPAAIDRECHRLNTGQIGPTITPPALDRDAEAYARRKMQPHTKVERRIIANLIAYLERQGWKVFNVFEGEEDIAVTDVKSAMEAIFSVDDSWLDVRNAAGKEHRIRIVLGNGVDCISDYSYTPGDADGWCVTMECFQADHYE